MSEVRAAIASGSATCIFVCGATAIVAILVLAIWGAELPDAWTDPILVAASMGPTGAVLGGAIHLIAVGPEARRAARESRAPLRFGDPRIAQGAAWIAVTLAVLFAALATFAVLVGGAFHSRP